MANTFIDTGLKHSDLQSPALDTADIRVFREPRLMAVRRPWIYAICAGLFCIGLLIDVTSAQNDRFVATAVIYPAGESQAHPSELPFAGQLSEAALRKVVEAQSLADDPEFVPQQWNWVSRIEALFGWSHFSSAYDRSLAQGASALERTVRLKRAPENRLEVEASSSDADKAARIADSLAQAIVDEQTERAKQSATQSRLSADNLVAGFSARLEMAKQRLADFQTRSGPESSGDETASIGGGGHSDPAAAVAEAKADIDRISHALMTGRTSSLGELHFQTPELDRSAAQYDELRQEFEKRKLNLGEKHPDLIALDSQLHALQKEIRGQWQKAADVATRNYRAAQARVLAFGGVTQASTETGPNAPPVSLAKLQSDVDVARENYEHALHLQSKAEGDMQPVWSVIQAHALQSAAHEPRGLVLGTVLMLGAMFGAGRTLTKDHGRSARTASASVTDSKASSGMFLIPRIRREWFWEMLRLKPELDAACQEALDHPKSDFSHAIEHLFELEPYAAASGAMKVLFVSTEDGLGTTTIAVNFAHIAAKAGHRVLLIEANRRRPILASLLSPNVRVNRIDLNGTKRIVCQLRPRLSVIPLLEEDIENRLMARAHHLIKGISRHFDFVILDGGLYTPDDQMMDMVGAVDRVFHLAPQGIEWRPGGRAYEASL